MTLSAGSAGSTDQGRSTAGVKTCWFVQLSGKKPFAMVGSPSTKAEALASARLIWPEAEVS